MKLLPAVVCILLLCFVSQGEGVQVVDVRSITSSVATSVVSSIRNFFGFGSRIVRCLVTRVASITGQLNLPLNLYKLTPLQSRKLANGNERIRLRLSFLNVPVYGVTLSIEKDRQGCYVTSSMEGTLFRLDGDILSVIPRINPGRILEIIRSSFGAAAGLLNITEQKTQLVIYVDNGMAKLAYIASSFAEKKDGSFDDEFPARPIYVVDAISGEVIANWDGLARSSRRDSRVRGVFGNSAAGLQRNEFSVEKEREQCFYEFYMNDDYKVLTYDNSVSPRTTQFRCSQANHASYDSMNGGYSPLNAAHRFAESLNALYVKVQDGYSVLTTNDLKLQVHYRINKAAFSGSSVLLSDGDDNHYPFTEPDMIGHEVAHAFISETSGLENKGQSGAIAESYSDMTGIALMNYLYGTSSYEIGATTSKNGKAFRDMCNPTRADLAEPAGIDHRSQYIDDGSIDVHKGSGIYSKAFCILSKKPGWGIEQAFKLFTHANAILWKPSETFESAACGAVKAASDLGLSQSDVTDALSQVGVACG